MTDLSNAEPIKAPRSQWLDVWDQFKSHKGAMAGAFVFITIVAVVFLGPLFWTIEATHIDIRARNQSPSWGHPFGTDQLGRDTFARMMAGGQTSISVGLTAMGLSLVLGTFVGVLAGFFRFLDGPLMRLTDLFLALPILPLLLVMMLLFREPLNGAFGPETGIFILIVTAIGITSWMPTARIVRGDVLALKEREFVLSARSIGTKNSRIITRHILPNVLSPVLVIATITFALAIIAEATLSFLGVGVPTTKPSLGTLIRIGQDFLFSGEWWILFFPAVTLLAFALSINLFGDWLRDTLNPKLK